MLQLLLLLLVKTVVQILQESDARYNILENGSVGSIPKQHKNDDSADNTYYSGIAKDLGDKR